MAKQVDVEELLSYIISYFSIMFTSPDALEIEVVETKQQVKGGAGIMPQVPPGMEGNAQMMQMMQMMMQGQNQGKVFEETFTNIENELYQVVAEEGLLISDKEFMRKILEECQDECFDLIIRKSFIQLEDLTDLKTLNRALSVVSVIAR